MHVGRASSYGRRVSRGRIDRDPRAARRRVLRLRRTIAVAAGLIVLGTAGATIASVTGSPSASSPAQTGTAPAAPIVPPSAEACAIDRTIDSWSTGTLHVDARDAATGEQLLGIRADDAEATGSTMKLLTAAAAVSALGPDLTLETRVVEGSDADTVVIVGGGDPTLSRLPSGQDSVYPDAAHLDDLAQQVRDARARDPRLADVPVSRVEVDASLFSGPAWNPGWPESARTSGSVSNITALMVDGDREDPDVAYSPRGDAAVDRAAAAFADLLGPDVAVGQLVEARPGAAELGSVRSAPIRDLVAHMLTHSDNTLAESLARLVAVAEGAGNDFAAVQAGTAGALDAIGIDVGDARLADGSGLSGENAVPAAVLTRLLVEVARGAGDLAVVDEGLAIAGRTGTLAEDGRFSGSTGDAAGYIRAKSGTLTDMAGLAGLAAAADGTTVAFTIWAEDTPPGASTADARAAVDALAAEMFRCGASL